MVKKLLETGVVGAMLLTTLPVLAQTTTTTPPPVTTPAATTHTVDLACMQSAVDKREAAIAAGYDTYSAAVKAALQARRDALKAAWSITDTKQRRAAVRAAWKAFTGSWKTAAHDLKTARHNAWKQFATDRKACGGSPADEGGSESIDAML